MNIFKKLPEEGKYAENYQLEFEKLQKIPEGQRAFAEILLSDDVLVRRFPEWINILSEPKLCQNLMSLISTFERQIQTQFYEKL